MHTTIGLYNADGFVSIRFDSSSILLEFIEAMKLAPGAPSVDDGTTDSSSHAAGDDDLDDEDDEHDRTGDSEEEYCERLTFGVADMRELHESLEGDVAEAQDELTELDWEVV